MTSEKHKRWDVGAMTKVIGPVLVLALLLSVPSFMRPPVGEVSDSFDTSIATLSTEGRADFASSSDRGLSSTQNPQGGVLVYMPNRTRLWLPSFPTKFYSVQALTKEELDRIRAFVNLHKVELGVEEKINLDLKVESESVVGSRRFVRFSQNVRRRDNEYSVPVLGASIVAIIENGVLTSLNNNLITPNLPPILARASGFEFKFTERELELFLTLLKTSPSQAAKMRRHFNNLGKRNNISFENFLKRELTEQEEILNRFFTNMGKAESTHLLLNMAKFRQLSLVHYGSKWMFQVTAFFGLPVEFDIMVPDDPKERLVIKNLRELRTSISIDGFTSPYFPAGAKTPGGPSAENAVANIRRIHDYYQDTFGLVSYTGKDPAAAKNINIHTALKGASFAENASWLGKREVFIIGEGGVNIQNLDNSISVLGHEYTHAVVQYSSGLMYVGESGAINEHIADIQGVTIEAEARAGGKFAYVIGEDILSDAIKAEKQKVAAALLNNNCKPGSDGKVLSCYSSSEISTFNLNRVGIRHLYAPELSYASQLSHYDQYRASYPANCEPSVANDNCGVHFASGILNKAAAKIISSLGLEATKKLFFNTVAYRLGSSSTFVDYLVQLEEECKAEPEIASKCGVISGSFALVGIKEPQVSSKGAATQETSVAVTPPVIAQALSPALKFCGWVDRSHADRVRIIDGNLNGTFMKRNAEVSTSGNGADLDRLACACVTGRITHLVDEYGGILNAFVDVSKVEDADMYCERDSRIRPLKAQIAIRVDPPPPRRKDYCGWVSVSAREKVISIIDNRLNPIIDITYKTRLAPYLSQKEATASFMGQCACVNGVVESAQLLNGKTGNVFREIYRAERQADSRCVGIRWSAIKLAN
jgi:hypothetical protein